GTSPNHRTCLRSRNGMATNGVLWGPILREKCALWLGTRVFSMRAGCSRQSVESVPATSLGGTARTGGHSAAVFIDGASVFWAGVTWPRFGLWQLGTQMFTPEAYLKRQAISTSLTSQDGMGRTGGRWAPDHRWDLLGPWRSAELTSMLARNWGCPPGMGRIGQLSGKLK